MLRLKCLSMLIGDLHVFVAFIGYKNIVSADDLAPSKPGHLQLQW